MGGVCPATSGPACDQHPSLIIWTPTVTSRLVPAAPCPVVWEASLGRDPQPVRQVVGGKVGAGMGVLRDCELGPLARCLRSEWGEFLSKDRHGISYGFWAVSW